jgi:hypothetical protein
MATDIELTVDISKLIQSLKQLPSIPIPTESPAELVSSNVVAVMRFKCPQCGPKYGADLNESDLPYGCYRCGRKDLEFVS